MFVYTSLFLPQCLPSSVLFFSLSSLLLSHRHIYSIFSSKSTFLNQHCLLFLHPVLSPSPFFSTLHWKMFYNRINIDMYLIILSPYNFVIFKDKNHSTHIYNQRGTRRTRYMSPYLQTLLTTTKISLSCRVLCACLNTSKLEDETYRKSIGENTYISLSSLHGFKLWYLLLFHRTDRNDTNR